MNLLKKYSNDRILLVCILAISVILYFKSCQTSQRISRLESRVSSVDSVVVSSKPVTKSDVDEVVSNRLYDFLIFEDDLDKKKTSLTDIKIKISKNAK